MSLAARLEKRPLALEQVVKIGLGVASAVNKAHGHPIIHRYLKPGNLTS